MIKHLHDQLMSAVFITFSGNCKQALIFYQTCFGGLLQFKTFEKELPGYTELPVVSGSLVSERIIIHGSDLVHNEGRRIGNNISIYLPCKSADDRRALIKKLEPGMKNFHTGTDQEPQLIEITDPFEGRWVLGI